MALARTLRSMGKHILHPIDESIFPQVINEYTNDIDSILNYVLITIFSIIQKMIFLFPRTYFSFDTTDLGIPSILNFHTGSSNRKYMINNWGFLNWRWPWEIRQRHYHLVCLQCTTSSQWEKLKNKRNDGPKT